jgi:hypothetical protein
MCRIDIAASVALINVLQSDDMPDTISRPGYKAVQKQTALTWAVRCIALRFWLTTRVPDKKLLADGAQTSATKAGPSITIALLGGPPVVLRPGMPASVWIVATMRWLNIKPGKMWQDALDLHDDKTLDGDRTADNLQRKVLLALKSSATPCTMASVGLNSAKSIFHRNANRRDLPDANSELISWASASSKVLQAMQLPSPGLTESTVCSSEAWSSMARDAERCDRLRHV